MSDHKPAQSHPEHSKTDAFDITETSYKTTHTAVRKARRFALQGLYEWLMTDHRFEQSGQGEWKANAPHDIAARTRATNAMHTVHLGYYHEIMREIPTQIDDLNALIRQYLDRDLDKIDMVEHAVLLIGAYELKHSLHIPYKVVLDESMKLNTHFGATDAHKLINAVMDKLAAELRPEEVAADHCIGYKDKKKDNINDNAVNTDSTTNDRADPKSEADDFVSESTGNDVHCNMNQSSQSKSGNKPRLSRKAKVASDTADNNSDVNIINTDVHSADSNNTDSNNTDSNSTDVNNADVDNSIENDISYANANTDIGNAKVIEPNTADINQESPKSND